MKVVLTIALVIVTGFFLINSHGSSATVREVTGVRAMIWGTGLLALVALTRLRSNVTLPKLALIVSGAIGLTSIVLSSVLGIWGYLTPPNFVYSLFRLQPLPLMIMGNGLLVVILLSLPLALLKKYGKYVIRFLPLWFVLVSSWVFLLPFDSFVAYATEDGPVENAQFIIALLSSLLLLGEAYLFFRAGQTRRTAVLGLIGLLLLFVTMEEISWGQRILNFQSPQNIMEVNVQHETNLHNIGIFNSLQYVGYITICLGGTIGGLLHYWHKRSWNEWIPTVLPLYLLAPAIYYIVFVVDQRFYRFAEIIEILFYAGILLWIWGNTRLIQKVYKLTK